MATLRIGIKESKFVSHNNVNLGTFEEHYVSGNGWEVTMSENGKLECVARQYYKGILHLVKFKVNKGYARLIIKRGDKRASIIKSFRLEEWPSEVVLGLPGGYIDNRRPYIRRKSFQDFLDKYEIESVRNESANGTYQLIQEVKDGNIVYYEKIETDGNAKLVLKDSENGMYRYEVTNASWVIKTVLQESGIIRILYTTDNPELIMNLPKK